jgi:hypothetical protein
MHSGTSRCGSGHPIASTIGDWATCADTSLQILIEATRPLGLTPVDVQYTGHSIKVLQLAVSKFARSSAGRRLWWWCEARDLRRSGVPKGGMQVSLLRRDT